MGTESQSRSRAQPVVAPDADLQRRRTVPTKPYRQDEQQAGLLKPEVASPPQAPREISSRRRSADTGKMDDRGVRFQNEVVDIGHSPSSAEEKQPKKTGSLRKPSVRQQDSPSISKDQSMDISSSQDKIKPDPVPPESVVSHHKELKYGIPPQTAAGIEARQRVGFGSRANGVTDAATDHHHRHHFSDMLHRKGHDQPADPVATSGPPRHLDEWRTGAIARLTLADMATEPHTPQKDPADKDLAWWEVPKSASERRRSRTEALEPKSATYDDSHENINGELIHFNFDGPGAGPGDFFVASTRRPRLSIYAGAQYVPNKRRPSFRCFDCYDQLCLCSSGCEEPQYPFDSPIAPRPFPFSCHLRRHYQNKKLIAGTKRPVRDHSDTNMFSPPLYLRCGPLLRYTGLRRDMIRSPDSGGPPPRERELWRGSVLIVTDDSQSEYQTVPTLRLFHQPMKLLPPPPQQIHGGSGEELPSEYVDPVAGLPKITRTGGVVYVKPVEDLDQGKDVSRIENDDGLYEETRTANVPTSYGKADELLGRSPSSTLQKNQSSRQERSMTGRYREVKGVRLHAERGLTFWRFSIEVELSEAQSRVAYSINRGATVGFWVPARGESMNVMFHSCNGFSLSVK